MPSSTSRRIGLVVFGVGVLYMLGLGWLYSWWMVPATRESGPENLSGAVAFIWALSAPLGSILVVVGASEEWGSHERLFGTVDDQVAEQIACSVLLVRRYVAAAISWIKRRLKG